MGRNSGGVVSRGGSSRGFGESIEHYVSGDGMWINNYLRGRGDFGSLTTQEKKYLKDLDSATGKVIGKEQTLFRSVDASAIFGRMGDFGYYDMVDVVVRGDKNKSKVASVEKLISRANGSTITEKGFMSTTKSEKIAHEWGDFSGSDHPIVLKIKAPKRTRGIDISNHEMAQGEVLLARGQKYKVKKVYSKNKNIVVDVDLI